MQLRIEKPVAHFLAITLAPECGEVFKTLHVKRAGWIRMPEKLELLRKISGLGDSYVLFYEAETQINDCFSQFIFPENTNKRLAQFDAEVSALSEAEKLVILKDFNDDSNDENIGAPFKDIFMQLKALPEAAQKELDTLSEDAKVAILHPIKPFLAFIYATFFNSIALMAHGQKLTTLVPLALQGNKKAFCQAVQIDRNLLVGHPYFRDTYARLQTGENPNFLDDISRHITKPPVQGRIEYPALYSLFATLDTFGWLDDFTASEILDMCDEAGLDRYQNRIEDENNLVRRRLKYRERQKIGF
ncbi:MAG: hypothetical protein JSR51_04720 [Proteobacteria bacterium]|nr:hypothetical protein [Pseudomonadota bacterium]